MTTPSAQQPQRIGAAPPKTTVWPVVLGVLSIVEGLYAMEVFRLAGPGAFLSLARTFARGGLAAVIRNAGGWWGFVCLASFSFGGMLGVLAGIMLLLRRRAALVLHWVYAPAVLAGAGVLLLFVLPPDMAFVPSRLLFRFITRTAVGLVYPAVVVIWFSRPSVWRHGWSWRTRAGRLSSRPAGAIWPTVLGTLAVYWGATGAVAALLTGAGLLLPLGDGFAYSLTLDRMLSGWPVHVAAWGSLALSGLSIAWGVLLRRRSRAGVVLCWLFVAGTLLHALGTPIPTVLYAIQSAGKAGAGAFLSWAVSLGARMLPMLAWTMFLLIWLSRAKVRAQVRAWGRLRGDVGERGFA